MSRFRPNCKARLWALSPRRKASLTFQAKRFPYPVRIAINIAAQFKPAVLVHIGGEIIDMHGKRLWQIDIALLAADQLADSLLAPAVCSAKRRFGKAEWLVDTHAAVAEGALLRGEEMVHGRVMHIDRKIIGE